VRRPAWLLRLFGVSRVGKHSTCCRMLRPIWWRTHYSPFAASRIQIESQHAARQARHLAVRGRISLLDLSKGGYLLNSCAKTILAAAILSLFPLSSTRAQTASPPPAQQNQTPPPAQNPPPQTPPADQKPTPPQNSGSQGRTQPG